eukprot:TRINITY_DN9552_c0_g1_i3.p1 TRINITY_DN9552_c0_g1~~TRINITY_DN9552_c0_g1_i3.p1  ORF type:complete len:207 (-),score=32.01 TRINITY_DN9552_c0_g1_i3:177-797(-)
MQRGLVGSEMCIRDRYQRRVHGDSNAARYVIPIYQDTHRCQGSWNKLYGASRCAMHHQRDSDRFVWRRSPICWQFDGKKVVEIPDCSDAGKLQLAAYAYDDYKKPFQNYGTLLKVFSTMVYTDQWYRYRIDQMTDESIYSLFDDAGNLMETQTIKHRQCYFRTWGYMLGFFFGGACPAPLQVDACYEFLKEQIILFIPFHLSLIHI